MANAIELKDIKKGFAGVQALKGVSFAIKKGSVHALIGENGAGKSTLMKILSGAQRADSGEIFVDGKKADIANPIVATELGIGIVYQELNNFMHLDVASNILSHGLPQKHGMINYDKMYAQAREILDNIGLTHISEKGTMSSLSLGAQQMCEIAGIVSKNADIVILDEPTSALTETETKKLFEIIADIKSRGVTVIYISHKLDEVLYLADEITVLKDGEHVTTFEKTPQTTKEELVRYMVGRDVEYDYKVGTSEIGGVILRASKLNRGKMVRDVDLELHKGEILGIAGLEGSGRTELLETLFGCCRAESGEIEVEGKKRAIKNPMEAKKCKMAYITKERKILGLFLGLSVNSNIVAASTERFSKNGIVQYQDIRKNTEKYVDAMSIKISGINQNVMDLSGGNQQKVLLAMWMTTNPDIIMIDEPTRGVDVGAKAEIHALLRKMAVDGKAIILVSSEMSELLASCDKIVCMFEGKITGILDNKEAGEESIMKLVSGLS
jgi:ABC-type sugar transport system ATPase subunit